MSFEPDTNDIRIRQLGEEIARIREEQFARAFPTNLGGSSSLVNSDTGVPAPAIGVTSVVPAVIRITKDTGVIDKLNYDQQVPNKPFIIGETITGEDTLATATIGDIDITVVDDSGTLILVPGSITGTFDDNENLNGSIDGKAKVDGTLFTQTGRGHLNAGAGSIIADADAISVPFEIHFIDNAQQDGQIIYMRAQDGQTIRLRRPLTTDATTGNLDIDESFNIIENALVFFQYQVASNASPTGGWVPLITEVSAGVGGTGVFQFPILYPKENLGTLNGVINLALNQSNGHYKQITLDGDASLTFSNLPPAINGFKFYVLTIQDSVGGHVYTGLPSSVIFASTLLGQLQTGIGAQTLWQFSTADGGTNWHATVITPQVGGADTPWTVDHDANSFDLFRLDKLLFFPAGGFSFPTDNNLKGLSTSGTGIEFNVPLPSEFRFHVGGDSVVAGLMLTINQFGFDFHDEKLDRIGSLFFTTGATFSSSIFPIPVFAQLQYNVSGLGSHHAFFADDISNPRFEIRNAVVKSNVDFDVVTNDIINIDQAQFDQFGGFVSSINHGERRITGGSRGMVMNIPRISPFAGGFEIFFENTGQTDSDKEYRFDKTEFSMFKKPIVDTLGLLFTNGGNLTDVFTHIELTASNSPVQTLLFKAGDGTTIFDLMELTGSEPGTGGVKLFTDLNMQTQNINRLDRLQFVADGGIVGNNQYAIAVDTGDTELQFNIPLTSTGYSFQKSQIEILELTDAQLAMRSNAFITNPSIISDGSFILGAVHLGGSPIVDGEFRLINNAGSLDVEVRTGGSVVNLSSGFGTSFVGFTADDDLDMGTFNIFNLDVLRFVVDGGVIGFNTYGISADPGDFSLNFSVPPGRDYIFQNNLDPIAVIDETGIQVLSNLTFTDPAMIAREFTATAHSLGTTGMFDGSWRLVGSDVIFSSGGTLVNLTTLSAGGADNLGNHIATQPLNLSNFGLINFVGWTSGVGQAFSVNPTDFTWDQNSLTNFYEWNLAGITHMQLAQTDLNMFNKQITNVVDPLNPQDVATKNFVDTQIAGVDPSTWSTFPATQNVDIAGFQLINTIAINGLGDGGGLIWSVPGVSILGGSSGFQINVDSTDTTELRFGGVSRAVFSNVGHALSGGNLNMNSNKIVNVIDPTNPQDVATRAFVLANAGGVNPGDNVVWTGTHTFTGLTTSITSPNIFIGDSSSDNIFPVGQFAGNLIPDSDDSFSLGSAVLQWRDLFIDGTAFIDTLDMGGNVNMNFNRMFNVPTTPLFANDVASKAYVDSQVGGGVSLSANNVFTGINTFTGSSHSITSTNIFLGDSSSDNLFISARIGTSLVPDNTFVDIGLSGTRWRQGFFSSNLFAGAISTTGDIIVGDDLQVNDSAIFFGSLSHRGSRIGFFNFAPTFRNTVFDVNATGNPGTDALLAIGAVNSLMFALEEYGLINVI